MGLLHLSFSKGLKIAFKTLTLPRNRPKVAIQSNEHSTDLTMQSPNSSPIHSKQRSPKQRNHDRERRYADETKAKVLFSPAQWREEDEEDAARQMETYRSLCNKQRDPRGDPLGVMWNLLEEDPEILFYMKHLPIKVPVKFLKRTPILGPKKRVFSSKNTLVLDLDETLVHCTTEPCEEYDNKFTVSFNGHDYLVYMKKRPYLDIFLQRVSKWYETIVFTASQKCYANTLLDVLDSKRKLIHHRVFRESCAHYKENFLKPLEILNRPLSSSFIIDNSPQCFGFQLENGIPITSWFDDAQDDELMRMLPYLEDLKDKADVRPYIKETFRVREFLEHL